MCGGVKTKDCEASTMRVECCSYDRTSHRFHFVAKFWKHELHSHRKHLPCILWGEGQIPWLISIDMRTFLFHEYGANSFLTKLFTNSHSQVKLGCSVTKGFAGGNKIWFYYRTLIHKTTLEATYNREVSRGVVMGVSVNALMTQQFGWQSNNLAWMEDLTQTGGSR